MPVMPAPTTSTSTGAVGGIVAFTRWLGERHSLYRERGIRSLRALPDRVPGPGTQAALPRPGLLPARGRAALVAGLADGLPARGDPERVRLRRVRVPRPVRGRRPDRGRR